jgi:5-methyltetrahydrofolate--homocysteine methyltransferase
MLILDGAWGTELQARGLAPGELPDSWNLTHPDKVADVARAYAEAGSDIILTNTFRSNRIALGRERFDVFELNRAGLAISRLAGPRVFASIGPSGKLRGDVSEEELIACFAEQAEALSGADALVIETMSDLQEAAIAVRAAKRTGLPVVASMVFDTGRNKDRTMMGDTPEKCAETLAGAGADIIGANCGHGVELYVRICERLRAATELPLWIKPNAGMPELEDGRPVYRTTPEEFAGFLPVLLSSGAAYVGGCCGTTPEFISALVKSRAEMQQCASS